MEKERPSTDVKPEPLDESNRTSFKPEPRGKSNGTSTNSTSTSITNSPATTTISTSGSLYGNGENRETLAASPTESHRSSAVLHAGQTASPRQNDGGALRASAARSSADAETTAGEAAAASDSKKRKTGPGSRGVANLTPRQLARKRAGDREAQRAIRERQKLRNQAYEQEIRELKSQQPYVELQAALRQKEAAEAETARLRSCLASIVAIAQPMLSALSGDQRPVYPSPLGHSSASGQPASSVTNASTPTPTPTASIPSPASAVGTPVQWQGDMPPAAPSPVDMPASQSQIQPQTPSHSEASMLTQQRHELVHGLNLGAERLELGFLLDATHRVPIMQSGVNGPQDSPQYRHMPMKHDWSTTTPVQASLASQYPSFSSGHQDSLGTPRHAYAPKPLLSPSSGLGSGPGCGNEDFATPILNCAPTSPLDSLLLDFLAERRQCAAEGLPACEVVGPRYPSVSSLLNPANSRFSHPLSKVFTDILATFPSIATLPERVAILYIMFLIMRWQISPTRENYERLPPWVRPSLMQRTRPHPAWFDHLPFQHMREKMVREYGSFDLPFENFFIPFTTTLSVNWPYEATDTLLQSPDSHELMINPVFERHLRRNKNWTLGDAFADTFPWLNGTYNLKSSRGGGTITLATQPS
ncbi:hypothetical protein QBC46DRAFT_1820 [Diplogelasinospora grovesii]|uniref:BZIP transcription factor n=1 Tax=Diplogelasinospora grovesii TaxID=303347 RepID=A0AAN6NI29_9PEZI|nr:hypothetical protein QBC46DRAFT_1820 [Diplogelasinospora grovesii]